MGVSTNAILFYGYCWDEEIRLLPEGEDEWVDVIRVKRGIPDPWASFLEVGPQVSYEDKMSIEKEWKAKNRAALDAYYEAKKAIAKEYGCDIGSHCSDSCSIPYIAIASAGILAYRGYPKPISADDLKTDPAWDGLLRKFCEDVGITPPEGQEPRWWLVSYWG